VSELAIKDAIIPVNGEENILERFHFKDRSIEARVGSICDLWKGISNHHNSQIAKR
jgi:hypothetical protein